MSEENAIVLPASIKASGSDRTIEVDPAKWTDPQGFLDYLLGYACGVILQRASAGKNDDAEKAAKAVDAAIERLQAGIVPALQTTRTLAIAHFRGSIARPLHSLSTLRAAIADDDARLASGWWLAFTV